jgi:hypothetical protein
MTAPFLRGALARALSAVSRPWLPRVSQRRRPPFVWYFSRLTFAPLGQPVGHEGRGVGPTFAPWVTEVPRRTALRNPLFSLRFAPDVRPPAGSIPSVRWPSERRGHTQAIPTDCTIVLGPLRLGHMVCRCRVAVRRSEGQALAISWLSYGPFGQLLWAASGSARQSTLR